MCTNVPVAARPAKALGNLIKGRSKITGAKSLCKNFPRPGIPRTYVVRALAVNAGWGFRGVSENRARAGALIAATGYAPVERSSCRSPPPAPPPASPAPSPASPSSPPASPPSPPASPAYPCHKTNPCAGNHTSGASWLRLQRDHVALSILRKHVDAPRSAGPACLLAEARAASDGHHCEARELFNDPPRLSLEQLMAEDHALQQEDRMGPRLPARDAASSS